MFAELLSVYTRRMPQIIRRPHAGIYLPRTICHQKAAPPSERKFRSRNLSRIKACARSPYLRKMSNLRDAPHQMFTTVKVVTAVVALLLCGAATHKVLIWRKNERKKKTDGISSSPQIEIKMPVCADIDDSFTDSVNDSPSCQAAPAVLAASEPRVETITKPLGRFFTGVLFMPDQVDLCWTYFATGACKPRCSRRLHHHRSHEAALWKLLNNIRLARTSIDMCMHTLTHPLVCIVLRQVAKRTGGSVRVRVILDGSLVEMRGGLYEDLLEDGFPVLLYKMRPGDPPSLLHHKFVVIDNELVMTGSYNWTVKGCRRNYENIICTVDTALVLPYVTEFDKMWKELDEEARRRLNEPPPATCFSAGAEHADGMQHVRELSDTESLLSDADDDEAEKKFSFG